MNKKLVFSSFALKLFAIFFMTIDHIGLLLQQITTRSYEANVLANIFRGLGRLALPLFIFMIVEGVLHTKSFKKYMLRLGILAVIIMIFFICITYIPFGVDTKPIQGVGNIFLDLSLTALTVYLIKHKNKYIKLLTLLPIAISIISFCVKAYEFQTSNTVLWYPCWLYLQYDWVSIALGLGFLTSKFLSELYVKQMAKQQNIDRYVFDSNGTTQFAYNLLALFTVLVVSVIHYASALSMSEPFWDYTTQTAAIASGAFLLFYNGKRGYNAKWFQYGCYIYYPLSIAILMGIYLIIS